MKVKQRWGHSPFSFDLYSFTIRQCRHASINTCYPSSALWATNGFLFLHFLSAVGHDKTKMYRIWRVATTKISRPTARVKTVRSQDVIVVVALLIVGCWCQFKSKIVGWDLYLTAHLMPAISCYFKLRRYHIDSNSIAFDNIFIKKNGNETWSDLTSFSLAARCWSIEEME